MGGMAIHFGLSAAYGLFFAWLQSLATVGEAALGALFGFALYVVDILMVPRVLPGMGRPHVTTQRDDARDPGGRARVLRSGAGRRVQGLAPRLKTLQRPFGNMTNSTPTKAAPAAA